MGRVSLLSIVLALALPPRALADVTVIYAPAAEPAPLVARPVGHEPVATRTTPEPAPVVPVAAPTEPPPRRPPPTPPPTPPPLPTPPPATQPPPLTPIAASPTPVAPPPPPQRTPAARTSEPARCPAPVSLVRVPDGARERRSLVLLDCEGRPDAESLTALSVLARSPGVPAPDAATLAAHAADPTWVAPSIRRLHPGLLERLRVIADAFPGHAIEIVSGVRPEARRGSRHLHGLALDLRVAGASLDALHALASRFERTGVGFYPVAGLVHLDVRTRATRWVDESGPGAAPRPTAVDAPPRARRIRGATIASPPAPAPPQVSRRDGDHGGDDEGEVDDPAALADEIAGEVTRALGDGWVPPPPPR